MTSENFNICHATISDLNQLREVDRICFDKDQWPLIELVAVLILPGIVRLKVDIDGVMAGFVGGDTHRAEGEGWVTTISVRPEYRRQGIARALMIACEEAMNMPAVRLSVRRSNYGAQKLYAELGYKFVDVWKKYYSDGEDALIMEKINLKID
ncbi:MAG: GNAT family N-acetyltransferase [Anaerolineaceae bacterium]